jgi:nickel-dependent lactate racemase
MRLTEDDVKTILAEAFDTHAMSGKRVLIIIPDSTRTAPIPTFFKVFYELLHAQVKRLDYLVALGTHPLMEQAALNTLVGITSQERETVYADVGIYNHRWDEEETFTVLGHISEADTAAITGGMLKQEVPVRVNRMVTGYDQIIICGPVFPHEVVGFSGGNKYFFPGIGGPEVINFTHWLGALITSYEVIGTRHTPVRAVIDKAASYIPTPTLACCMVVKGEDLYGVFVDTPQEAWARAADVSARVHVTYLDRPLKRVLSVLPEMYDDIWTGAKGMYKLEPVIADGGEVILYAPHIDEVSYTHGHLIDEIGYHVRDYFVKQWDRFKGYPWGVLAHSTHLRGVGTYENGIEKPRIRVTLATRIPKERCERINLGYMPIERVNFGEWRNRGDEGIMLVPHAGETLFRLS